MRFAVTSHFRLRQSQLSTTSVPWTNRLVVTLGFKRKVWTLLQLCLPLHELADVWVMERQSLEIGLYYTPMDTFSCISR